VAVQPQQPGVPPAACASAPSTSGWLPSVGVCGRVQA